MPADLILSGMTWSDPRGYEPLEAASEAFKDLNPDVRIDWDKRSLQEFESTPIDELAARYDLLIIDHPHVGTIVEENCLLPLDLISDATDLDRLRSQTVGKSFQSYFYKGHQWALPVDAACQVQAIRPDLLDHPVKTFSEVLTEAKEGRVLIPLRPPHILMTFLTLMANLGHAFPVTSQEGIHHPTATNVLSLMQEIIANVDPACFDADPIAALDMLASGTQFALCPLTYLYVPYSRKDYRDHLITFHDMPSAGRTGPLGSALGGTGIAVSSQTKHAKLCTEFALWVASAEIQTGLYSDNNGQAGNAVAWADERVNSLVSNAFFNTRMSHEAAWLRPRHSGYMDFQEEGSQVLLDGLKQGIPASKIIEALKTIFEESYAS